MPALVGFVLLCSSIGITQSGSAQSTGSLVGTVVDRQTGEPVRHVRLTLLENGTPPALLTLSDSEGRFSFEGLAEGTFTLEALKTGFVREFVGSRRPGSAPGLTFSISKNQQQKVRILLTAASAIEGRVDLPSGVRPNGVRINLARLGYQNGEPSLVSAGTGTYGLDDRLRFRIPGLPPNDYFISVSLSPDAGVPVASAAEIAWARSQLSGAPSSGSVAPPPSPSAAPVGGLAPTYYPGSTDFTLAAPIRLSPGEERRDIQLAAQLVPVAELRGTIRLSNGQEAFGVQASLVQLLPFPRTVRSITTAPQGSFAVTGIPPGEYYLIARGADRPPAGVSQGLNWWAKTTIHVPAAGRLDGISVTLRPGISVRGTVRSTSAAISTIPFQLQLVAAEYGPRIALGVRSSPIAKDGSFEFAGVAQGRYFVTGMNSGSSDWFVHSVTLEGRDANATPLEVTGGRDILDVQVSLTNRPSVVTGVLLDPSNVPHSEVMIAVFPQNPQSWFPNSPRIRAMRPDSNGVFTFTGLPSGDYLIAVVEDLDPGQVYDRRFLEQVVPSAIKVNAKEGLTVRQDLKISR